MEPTDVVLRYGSAMCVVAPGGRALVGRGAPDQPADVRLSTAVDLSRAAAVVSHEPSGGWSVHAVSTRNGISVRHSSGSQIQVAADQTLEMPSWFDDVYLVVTTPSAEYEVRVHRTAGVDRSTTNQAAAIADHSTKVVLPRDPARADYRTALCLCEPLLDDPFNRRIPTEGELAARLVHLGYEDGPMSARTVERRLARLRERLGVATNAELRDRLVAACLVTKDALDELRRRNVR